MNKTGNKVNHQQIKRYLVNSGWTEEAPLLNGALEKFKKDNKIVSLITETALPTYDSYIEDTVNALSIFEKEEPSILVRKIEGMGNHKLRVVLNEGQPGNRIKLIDSQKLRNSMSDIVLSASHSTLSCSINHPRLSKKDALDFHAACYEDQTERGSYIANFLIPASQIESVSGEEVFQTIKSAFITAKDVATREVLPSPDDYENLASQGISANLLKAISDLKEITSNDNIRFQFDEIEPLVLSVDELNNLSDFYSEIVSPTNNTETIIGKVIACSAHPECTATVEVDTGRGRYTVKVKITADQYERIHNEEHNLLAATHDIANRPTINVTGTLKTRSKGRREMAEITAFSIIPYVPQT